MSASEISGAKPDLELSSRDTSVEAVKMAVEVERDQGEVSVKVDNDNATDNKEEVVVPTTVEGVGNGISHGGDNGNGNDKEDSDGSYDFITENDTVGDDSVKVVDGNVEKDLKEAENMEMKLEATSSADEVLGVPKESQPLEKSERESSGGDEPEEVSVITKSETEVPLEASVAHEHSGNGHMESGHEGKLESIEEVGSRDLTKNNVEEPTSLQEKPEGKIECGSKTDAEGHQGDKIKAQEKSDLDVDVSKDLQHDKDVANHPVDSDEGREPVLASAEISSTDLSDGGMSVGEPTVTDPPHTSNGSESVNDHTGTESVAVLESVAVENDHPVIESELEKIGDVPLASEAEKVSASNDDVLPESGTVEDVSEVSSDVLAESQAPIAISLDSHTSGSDGVVENGNSKSESEATQDLDSVDNSKVQSEVVADDVSMSDKSMISHPESQDASEPACDQDEKQHIASEVTDAVIVPKESVSEATPDDLSSTNQQESEPAESEKVTILSEKHTPGEKVQENNSEESVNTSRDAGLNTAEEVKESPTDLSGNVSQEDAETISTSINGPSSLSDPKIAVPEMAESSAGAATESEAAEAVKECTEPHVASLAIKDGEINRVANSDSESNVTKTPPVDVCEDIAPKEVSDMKESDIKERSGTNTDKEVDSDTKSIDSTKSPLVNNGMVGEEGGSGEEKNEASGTTDSVASEIKIGAQDHESKDVTSTDAIQTGVEDSVESQPAENKEGDSADKTDDKVAASSTVEGSASEGHAVAAEIEKRPFYFLPRVPRYDDEKLTEQLKHAEDQVEQKTKSRDALREDIQNIRATCKDYDISYKAAIAEERSARKAMHSKRQEIEALQSVISRVKSAASVDDIDSRVHNMEHMIQHETLSLNEEKGLIRELKQLRQLREQISSSMGTKDEVKQALDDKEKTEERLKVLRKELDGIRNDLSKAEAVAKAAKKKCDEEWDAQSKLQEKFRAADAIRQEAFSHLQDLKKQQREKNKYFFKYRDDSRAASEMALKKDRASLQKLCSDQVENFMNMWNDNEEFRKYYVRCNTRSTVRRLGTLDGRSLGPDEEPPRITYATRTDKLRTPSSNRTEKHETALPPPPVSVVKYEGSKAESTAAEQKKSSQTAKPKKPDQQPPPPVVKESVSVVEEVTNEPPKLTKEEEELIKKEEEKRKQKEAKEMKEKLRLEEIAKAKEAMERKKKREEKAKARAVLKAQKEAEEREKEREKKLRKKERRKGIVTSEETTETPTETSETVITETPREVEIPEESQQIKKPRKPSSKFVKQNKSKSIPLPLRNRGSNRKLRQWLWIGLAVLVVLALFLLGNANLSFSPENLWFV